MDGNIDKYIGQEVARQRRLSGLSQKEVGTAIGLTFQQIHKYESGHNRIAAGTLFRMSKLFGVGIDDFFEASNGPDHWLTSRSSQGEARELCRYVRVMSPIVRPRLVAFIQTVADEVPGIEQSEIDSEHGKIIEFAWFCEIVFTNG